MSAPLSQMVALISAELGVYDDTSLGLIRSYLSKNYLSIWDKYPWADTIMAAEVTVPLGGGGMTVPYPEGMDRVITIRARTIWQAPDTPILIDAPPFRSDSRFLDPVTSTYLVETDPDMFERVGPVTYYEESTDETGKFIRLYPIPNKETKLYIIAKAQCPGFSADTDTSRIRNVDQALIAYATADMLRRLRQYGKAEILKKTGLEFETAAWNLEQQQANQPRRIKATTVAGNSLAEMTDAVCAICGQWTPDYRLIIREFLRRNYQTFYDSFLWAEGLIMVRVPFTNEQVILPYYIDKVIGVRGNDDMRMFPADAGLILDILPSTFTELGPEISYTTLTPVAVDILPSRTTQLRIASTSVVDTGPVFIRGELIEGGLELEEEINLNGTVAQQTVYGYDIPITISKDITVGDVTISSVQDGQLLGTIPKNQRELKHQRLWFLGRPDSAKLGDNENFHCLVLAKRAIRPLLTDQDTPIITGAQQVLIAAAAADLFRKLEKHDMATAMLQKAEGAMNVLKSKNTDQAASAPRFVPQVEPRAYADYGCTTW